MPAPTCHIQHPFSRAEQLVPICLQQPGRQYLRSPALGDGVAAVGKALRSQRMRREHLAVAAPAREAAEGRLVGGHPPRQQHGVALQATGTTQMLHSPVS